jgi:predicted lipid-binding transport protein (Tim44 family)
VDSGVKVVGAVPDDVADEGQDPDQHQDEHAGGAATESAPAEGPPPRSARPRPGGAPTGPDRRTFRIVSVVAALGLIGTLVLGILYATDSGSGGGSVQDPAVLSASRAFLSDFFNFTPKTVDSDFNALTAMATGQFSSQAQQFFNSNIRKALETALATSRGSVRYLEVEQEGNPPGTAQVYAVIDQLYANNKINTPQSDVVRLIADLQQVNGAWKISNVTVLEGATPQSASGGNSGSGSAGSSVPGQ